MHKINFFTKKKAKNIASRENTKHSKKKLVLAIINMMKRGMVTMYDDEAQNYNNFCICVVQYDGAAQY